MDARSVQVQQQLGERDAEINRLQRELRVRNQNNGLSLTKDIVTTCIYFLF